MNTNQRKGPFHVVTLRELVVGPGHIQGYHVIAPRIRYVEPVRVTNCTIEYGEEIVVTPL